jgi:hypothetical protein
LGACIIGFVVVLDLFFQQYKLMLRFEDIEDTELPETAENEVLPFAYLFREAIEPVILFRSGQAAEVVCFAIATPGICARHMTEDIGPLNLPVWINGIVGRFSKRYVGRD